MRARVRRLVEVAIVNEGFQLKLGWPWRSGQCVSDKGGVFAVPHPDPLFEYGVSRLIGPDGDRALETKLAKVSVAFGCNGAAEPTMRSEFVSFSVDVQDLVD